LNSCGKDWKRRCWQAARHSLTEPARAQVVLAEDGASASAHSNLGNVHLQTGRPALALQDFDTAVSLAPEARAHTGAVLAAMDGDRDFDHSVPNAWLASSRHHPFWLFVLQTIIRTAGKGDMSRRARARPALPCPRALTDSAPPPSHWRHVVQRPLDTPCLAATICADPAWQGMAAGQGHGRARAGQHRRGPARRADWVEATTGPVMLHTAIKAFQRANGTGLTILDPGTIYAINWRQTYVLHQAGRRSATWSCATSSTSTLTRPRARRCSPTPTR